MNIKALHAIPRPAPEPDGPEEGGWRPPRRRRWGLWIGVACVVLIAGLAVGYRLWTRAARARLDATLDQLRREGEPVSPADLARPPVAPDDNAVFDLRAAAMLIDATSVAWKNYQSIGLEDVPPEQARSVVAKVLEPEESRKALARVRAARGKRSADWQTPVSSPLVSMLLPDLGLQRNVAELCRAAATDARSRKDYGDTVEYTRDILVVSRAAMSQPALISHLTAVGISMVAAGQVEEALPTLRVASAGGASAAGPAAQGEQPATPEQVRGLIAELLDESDCRRGLIQGLRDERVMELDTALAIVDGKLDAAAVFAGAGVAAGSVAPAMLMPKPMILSDAKILVDYNTATIKALQRSPDYPAYGLNAPADPFGPAGGQPLRGHAMARLLMPAYQHAIVTHYHALAERRLAAAALAVKWYQADHDGKPPATLEELVPKYLPAAPADPFAPGGKPLRYAAEAKRLVVYSVGENGVDDGASDAPMSGRRLKQQRWDHLDAVLSLKPKEADDPDVTPAPGKD